MSERAKSAVMAGTMIVLTVLLLTLVSTHPAATDRVDAIGSRIKCPVCQGESIADSPSQMAKDMMSLVAERVTAGATDQQILDEIQSSYSGAVLLDPPVGGATLLLWMTPGVVLLGGIAVILWWKRHPGDEEVATNGGKARRNSRRRLIVGGAILVAAFAGIVVVAANSLQDRAGGAEGVADLGQQDLSQVSNDTMEAVIAANLDNPQIDGMRLALAERYYQAGDYRSAFPHYLAVAEDPKAADDEALTALVRLAWMTYDGNGEVDTALNLVDQALAIDPNSSVARYVEARLEWCGNGDAAAATAIFTDLLDRGELPEDSRSQIEKDLALAGQGASCP
ncbi:MAG: cytochrome c-type biogenesis protein CcmH [Acidimicrobiia bacterium]